MEKLRENEVKLLQDEADTVADLDALFARLVGEDEDDRWEAGRELQKRGTDVAHVLEMTDDPNPIARGMACFVLGQIGGEGVTEQNWLSPIYNPVGVPILRRLLAHDAEADVRANAAAALGWQNRAETLPDLCRAAADSSPEVRFDVTWALGSFLTNFWEDLDHLPYRPTVIAALLQLMDDVDDDVRDWATFGIHQGSHDTPETRTRLWQALDDANSDVQGEAAAGLALFDDRSFVPRLAQMLRDGEYISTLLLEAAETFADPALLPAVVAASEHWRPLLDTNDDGDRSLLRDLDSAIATLQATSDDTRQIVVPPEEPNRAEIVE